MNYGRRTPLPEFKTKFKFAMSDELPSEDDKQGCKRKCRNASEKKRRDQFNCLIQELGCMVSTKNRKMDKSAVLRSTINFLKSHNDNALKSETLVKEKWKPSFLSDNEFSQLMLEALDGFLIVFSHQGHILYTSCSITSLLRHLPKDLENCTIYELVHEDDRPKIFKILSEVENSFEDEELLSKRFTFHCQMRRGSLQPNDLVDYEMVKFHGNFTMISNEGGVLPLDMGLTRYCFVATVCLQTTQLSREMATFGEQQNKFMSRHSLDWKFLFLDHRGPPIIGYLPFEVLGTSVYDYYHQDDLEKVVHCHEALIQTSEGISCYYRFLTKGLEWIWLQTRNYITYNQWNSKPEFIVCTHKVVNYAEVRNDVNLSLNLTEDSRKAADKSDSWAAMDSHTSTSDMSASISPVSSIDSDHYQKKCKKSKALVSFHGDNSHHLVSDQEGLPSSSSTVSAVEASDFGQKQHQIEQSTLAPELVMVQIKLQEQLVQRHHKLQDAILQQQKELQSVQQQLLVAQQFLMHSSPFFQELMPQTTQPGGQVQSSMPSSSSALVPAAMSLSTLGHMSTLDTGAQLAESFFPQMLQDSQQDGKAQVQRQDQQQHQLFQGESSQPSSSRQIMPVSSPGFLVPGQSQSIMARMLHQNSASVTAPCLTVPVISTTNLSMAREHSGRDGTDCMDSTQLAISGLQADTSLSHRQGSPNSQSQAGSIAADPMSPREPQPFRGVPQYQMQNLSPDMDPSSIELIQQMLLPPHTQSGHL